MNTAATRPSRTGGSAENREHFEAFQKAVRSCDLTAAFAAWMAQRATRFARYALRNEAINCEARQRTGRRILPELRDTDANFLNILQEEGDKAANAAGNDLADQIIGERPTTVD